MPLTFSGGSALPAVGTAAYNAAASAPSGAGSYNASTGVLTSGGSTIYNPANPNATNTPVTAANLGTTQAAQLPQAPLPQNPGNLVTSNNAALATALGPLGYSLNANGQFEYKPPTTTGTQTPDAKSSDSGMSRIFRDYLGMQKAPPSATDIYNSLPEKAARESAQQQVNNYTAQLNGIVAKSQADQLSLVGQGRGVPEAIIGGQQAQIAREAAIQALPVQAQLAAAQGNLQLATEHLDTVFKLRTQDAQAQYQYQNKLIDSVFDFATKAEQRRLDDMKADKATNLNQYNNALNFAQAQATLAVQNGQGGIGAQIAKLTPPDVNSKNFPADLQAYNTQVANLMKTIVPKSTAPTGKYNTQQDKYIDQINTGVSNSFSYKAVNAAKAFADGVVTALKQENGLSDIAAINQFQKVIDEGAVTRDQDVKLVQSSQSLLNSLKLKVTKLEKGDQLSPEQRKQMDSTVKSLYEAKVRSLTDDPYVQAQIIKANQNGIEIQDTILGQLGTFGKATSSATPSQDQQLLDAGYTQAQIDQIKKAK